MSAESRRVSLDGFVRAYMEESARVILAIGNLEKEIKSAASLLVTSLESGRTVFWMGNGGSAADAQHLAAELVGRFESERRGLSSVALTTDSSVLTALGNDFGFENVFQRQVQALVRVGDVVVGISTSGKSRNVILALDAARLIGASTILLTGMRGEVAGSLADLVIRVPSDRTCHIQEGHIAIGQVLCGIVEDHFA